MILAWLSGAFIVGITVGSALPPAVRVFVACACLFALIAWFTRASRAAGALLVMTALSVGIARSPHAHAASPGEVGYYVSRQVQLTGVVNAEPDQRDTGANYEVAVDGIVLGAKTSRVSGDVWIHTSRAVVLDYPDRVTFSGRLVRASYSPFAGAAAEVRFPRIVDAGPASTGPLGWIVPFRQHLEDGINRWLPEPEAALLIAITLGARSASLGDLAPALVSTGLIHLIAISGIKVALVAGTVGQLFRSFGNRLVALLASLAALLGYLLVTGATSSGTRSALMWALIFIAGYLGRSTVTIVSLSVVAAIMLALDPSLITNIGFLLSTVGTFSIVAFTLPLIRWLRHVPSPFREALATTFAAQVGTIPIVIFGFHVVSASGPLANMLVLPVLPALIPIGFAIGVFGGVGAIATPAAALAYVVLHLVIGLARALATWPAAIPSGSFAPAATVLYYSVLALAAATVLRRSNWAPRMAWRSSGREMALTGATACALLTASLAFGQADLRPRLYWLGSGQAVVVRSAGTTLLIGGSPQPLRLLERMSTVIPSDTHRIDLLIVTDPRSSSLAGDIGIFQHYAISEVLDVGAQYPSSTYARWRALLRDHGIPTYSLRTGVTAEVGSVRLVALDPDGPCGVPANCAGMLRLSIGGKTVLLAGSASRREQNESVFRGVNMWADALVCPTIGCDSAFVSAVRPRFVFASGPPPGTSPWHRLPTTRATVIDP
jgi:competence protein ComEC